MEKKSSNTIQAYWVLLGSLSAFGFAIVSSMVLSRYFDKHDYGTYKQVMYVYGTLVVVFTLGLPRAFSFFLPRVNKGQAKDLISKINLVLMGLGAMMSLALLFGADLIAGFLRNNDLATPLRYFSLVPFFMLPTMGLEGILSTYRKTQFLALYKTVSQIFMLLCVVVPVILFQGDVKSAIIGFTISSFLCFLTALFFKHYPLKGYSKKKSPYSYREIFNYTLPIMGASIWGIIIRSSDQFFISRYFGNEVFAEFANGSMELPFVGMIIASSATVLSPVFARQVYENGGNSKNDIMALWRSVLGKTIKLIYPLVAFCFCFADIIMMILFGEEYHNSGIYFQIKLVVNFFTLITYGPLLLAIDGQKFYYKVHAYGAVLLLLMEWFVVVTFESPYLVTAVSVLCQIGRIIVMISYIAKYFKITLRELIPINLVLNILIPSFIILYSLRHFCEKSLDLPALTMLVVSAVAFVLIFGIWVYFRKIDYFSIVRPLLGSTTNMRRHGK